MIDSTIPRPEHIAAKLNAAANRAHSQLAEQFGSRLKEVLWTIESWRREPGGVCEKCRCMVAHAGEAIFPEEIRRLPRDSQGQFSADDALAVLNRLPAWAKPTPPEELRQVIKFIDSAGVTDVLTAKEAGISDQTIEQIRGWLTWPLCLQQCAEKCAPRLQQFLCDLFFEDLPFPDSLSCKKSWGEAVDSYAGKMDRLSEISRALASGDLRAMANARPGSTKPTVKPFRIMAGLPALLIGYMDFTAEQERKKVADTRVIRLVFETVAAAVATKKLFSIIGPSRCGKTTGILTYQKVNPGLVRVVQVPPTGGEHGLLLRMAKALGVDCDPVPPLSTLRKRVYPLLSYAPALLFDEAHYILPASYSSSTTPVRLNCIRDSIVDAQIGCVLVETPQAHTTSMRKFIGKTGYAMNQWFGRLHRKCTLPDEFSEDEMTAVAKVKLPELSESCILQIVGLAMGTNQFLQAIECIGTRAKELATARAAEASPVLQMAASSADPTAAEIDLAADEFISGISAEIEELLPHEATPQVRGSKPQRTASMKNNAPRRIETGELRSTKQVAVDVRQMEPAPALIED
jgi:hypothetical protein